MNRDYKTTDFRLAVILSMTFNLKEISVNNKKGTFIFESSPEMSDYINAFYDRQLQVEPISHDEARDLLKNKLYSNIGGKQ